jgi:hypothetical protein
MNKDASHRTSKAVPRPGARGRPQKRAEQRRAVDTRRAILDAALVEFAEKGFDAASIRATALVALKQLPTTRQPTRNIADMKMLLNSLYPPPDVSIHLTTARWRFLPNLRPLGAREI